MRGKISPSEYENDWRREKPPYKKVQIQDTQLAKFPIRRKTKTFIGKTPEQKERIRQLLESQPKVRESEEDLEQRLDDEWYRDMWEPELPDEPELSDEDRQRRRRIMERRGRGWRDIGYTTPRATNGWEPPEEYDIRPFESEPDWDDHSNNLHRSEAAVTEWYGFDKGPVSPPSVVGQIMYKAHECDIESALGAMYLLFSARKGRQSELMRHYEGLPRTDPHYRDYDWQMEREDALQANLDAFEDVIGLFMNAIGKGCAGQRKR